MSRSIYEVTRPVPYAVLHLHPERCGMEDDAAESQYIKDNGTDAMMVIIAGVLLPDVAIYMALPATAYQHILMRPNTFPDRDVNGA